MKINEPIVTQIYPDTYLINEFGLSCMYLLIGKKRALLIDTGCGASDLLKTVSSLTDLPIITVLTHAHVDHAGTIKSFDKVFLHKNDLLLAKSITREFCEGYLDYMKGAGGDIFERRLAEIPNEKAFPQFEFLEDGEKIDLGGRTVEVVFTPGHTRGSLSFIDDESGFLFSGDCCNRNLLLAYPNIDTLKEPRISDSVETELKSLIRLKMVGDRYTCNFTGHICWGPYVNVVGLKKEVLENCIALLEKIMNGTAENEVLQNSIPGNHLKEAVYKDIAITYDDRYITEDI